MSTYQSTVLWTVPWKYKNARHFIFSKCTANNILTKKEISEKSRPKRRRHVHQSLWQLHQSKDNAWADTNYVFLLLLKVKRVHCIYIPVLSKITWTLRINLFSFFFLVLYLFTSRKNVFKVNQVCFRPGYTSNHSSSTPSVIPDLFTLSCIWNTCDCLWSIWQYLHV